MGLSISVGVFSELASDEEAVAYHREQMAAVNRLLQAHGVAEHHEPEAFPEGTPSAGGDMFGYSGLHYLRRLAAHLADDRPLPAPGDDKVTEDRILRQRYRQAEARTGVLSRLFGRRSGPGRFDHLINHSDAEGYYVPVDFATVIVDPSESVAGGLLGSSVRLRAECEELAAALDLPLDLDPEADEVWEAADSQGEGSGWRAYGIESHTCLRLLEASEWSIKLGAAVVFH